MAHVRDRIQWTLVLSLALNSACGFKVNDFIAPNSAEAKKAAESNDISITGPTTAKEDDAIDLTVDTSKLSGSGTITYKWSVESLTGNDAPALIAIAFTNGTKAIHFKLPQSTAAYNLVLRLDAARGGTTWTRTKALAVTAVNDAPTIAIPTPQLTPEATTINIPFTIVDEHPEDGVVVASATDKSLIPDANVKINGTGASRTLSITPVQHKSGSTQIYVQVADKLGKTSSTTFILNVSNINEAPFFTKTPSDQTINQDTDTGNLEVGVNDYETPTALTITGSSNNNSVVPNSGIVITNVSGTRYVKVTPAAGASGSATITLVVSDGQLNAQSSFKVNVTAVNHAPTISPIADQIGRRGATVGPIAFTVNDVDGNSLSVSASSSNTDLVKNNKFSFGGSGNNRTISFQPENVPGTAIISVSVTDNLSAPVTVTFKYTVAVVDDFNRADQGGLGTSTSGIVWNANAGDGDSIGIVSNRAQCASTGAMASCGAVLDSGESNGSFKIKIADYQNSMGGSGTVNIFFRRQDRDNTWLVSIPTDPAVSATITERSGGVSTDRATFAATFAPGDVVQIDLSGPSITATLKDSSGTQKGTANVSSTDMSDKTTIGFRASISNGSPGTNALVSFDDLLFIP